MRAAFFKMLSHQLREQGLPVDHFLNSESGRPAPETIFYGMQMGSSNSYVFTHFRL